MKTNCIKVRKIIKDVEQEGEVSLEVQQMDYVTLEDYIKELSELSVSGVLQIFSLEDFELGLCQKNIERAGNIIIYIGDKEVIQPRIVWRLLKGFENCKVTFLIGLESNFLHKLHNEFYYVDSIIYGCTIGDYEQILLSVVR